MDQRRIAVALCAGLMAAPVGAQEVSRPVSTRLIVGHDVSTMREEHEVNFVQRERTLWLDVSSAVDLATVWAGDAEQAVRLLDVRRTPPAPPAFDGVLSFTGAAPRLAETSPQAQGPLAIRLISAVARPRRVEVRYQVPGLSWEARYELTIRGDINNHLEPLSLDLEARLHVSNALDRAVRADRLLLRGPAERPVDADALPRFLMLDDDSPLADRWRPGPPPQREPQLYSLLEEGTVLPPGQVVGLRVASARRMATERLYTMDSESIPLGSPDGRRPLRQWMVIRNEARAGLGMPLPAGSARISAGSGRSLIRQHAVLGHTPAGGLIRVDLGDTPGVTGSRRSLGRTRDVGGIVQETIELRVANGLDSAVRVELVERPPVPLAWDMVRSSRPYELVARRLRYELQLAPREEVVVSYTVRLSEPEG